MFILMLFGVEWYHTFGGQSRKKGYLGYFSWSEVLGGQCGYGWKKIMMHSCQRMGVGDFSKPHSIYYLDGREVMEVRSPHCQAACWSSFTTPHSIYSDGVG